MTPKKDVEIRGNFLTHPFAEVIAEIAHARLSGSVRLEAKDRKSVVYFRDGSIVFAASNARSWRLFELLLGNGKVAKNDLTRVPNFSNDFELAAYLEDMGLLTKAESDTLFSDQVAAILIDSLSWREGEWRFSHLTRARDGLDIKIRTNELLANYSRALPADDVLKRFRSLDEKFERSSVPMNGLDLSRIEAFVLSRAEDAPLKASDIAAVSTVPETSALHVLYTLWLAGLLERTDWQPVFSAEMVEAIRSARLEIRKEASIPTITSKASAGKKSEPQPEATQAVPPKGSDITLTVEEYLDRVESSETYYELLDVDLAADAAEIKRAYFGLAKMFHPDKYHSEGGELLRRVQHAFTELSQAHETLKDPPQRELYDYRMRTEIAARKKAAETGESVNTSTQLIHAADAFDRGFTLLMNKEIDEALPLLARAAGQAPNKARYRAYYGMALSFDTTKHHKAEAEMQAALKLDPENASFRLMLAEFFIGMGLKKRAEGELNRLLKVFPSNGEAREMLARLKSS